jgi:GT2 family glycosyltransferase
MTYYSGSLCREYRPLARSANLSKMTKGLAIGRHVKQHPYDCPRISCILPVYNGERYLRTAIQSILGQTYTNLELIIVDDGSTDRSGAIAEEIAATDPRVCVVHQANQGISAALNAAIALSTGKYIARMDANDLALPKRFERQVAILEENADIVLLGCVCDTIGPEDELLEPAAKLSAPLVIGQSQLDSFPPVIHQVWHPSIMVRAEALRQIGGYSVTYEHCEDYDLYLRIARLGAIAELNEPLLLYRKHEASISQRHWREQEAAVALSEVANTNERRRAAGLQELSISKLTLRGYIAIRIFRSQRWEGVAEPGMLIKAILFTLAGVLHSDRAISAVILMEIARNISAWIRNAP